MSAHVWAALRVGFWMLCSVGALAFVLWVAACIVSSCVAANQRRAHAQRRGNNYRVGGVISP